MLPTAHEPASIGSHSAVQVEGPSGSVVQLMPPSHAKLHASYGAPASIGAGVPPSGSSGQAGNAAASAATSIEPQPLAESKPGPAEGPVMPPKVRLPDVMSWKAPASAATPMAYSAL